MPVELPSSRFPHKVAVLREETASLRLLLEEEIDQFHLEEEEGEEQEKPVIQVSDSKGELDRSFVVRSPKFIVALVDDSFEEQEEIALNKKKGLRKLLIFLLSPLLSPPTVNLFAVANLQKNRKEKEVAKEGGGPLKGSQEAKNGQGRGEGLLG